MPSKRSSFFFVQASAHTSTLIATRITISITFSMINVIGLIVAAIPSTNRILKILEPITLPSAISSSFLRAATTEVTSSGRLVPQATIVSPIRFWLSPSFAATVDAPFTTKSPPNLIATIPPTINTIHFHTGNTSYSSSPAAARAFSAERTIQTRKATNTIRRMIPSALPSCIPRYPQTKSRTAQTTENGNSFFNVLFST